MFKLSRLIWLLTCWHVSAQCGRHRVHLPVRYIYSIEPYKTRAVNKWIKTVLVIGILVAVTSWIHPIEAIPTAGPEGLKSPHLDAIMWGEHVQEPAWQASGCLEPGTSSVRFKTNGGQLPSKSYCSIFVPLFFEFFHLDCGICRTRIMQRLSLFLVGLQHSGQVASS